MIIKAMEIAEAVESAVFDEGVRANAQMLLALHEMKADNETFIKAIFAYSAMLSATVGDKVTKILLTENDFDKMLNEIEEFQELEKGVLGEQISYNFSSARTFDFCFLFVAFSNSRHKRKRILI